MRNLTGIKDKRLTLEGGPEDTVASIFHSLRERLDTLALAMGWSSSVRTFTVNSDNTQQQVWFGFSTQTNFQWIQYTDKISTTCSKAKHTKFTVTILFRSTNTYKFCVAKILYNN